MDTTEMIEEGMKPVDGAVMDRDVTKGKQIKTIVEDMNVIGETSKP